MDVFHPLAPIKWFLTANVQEPGSILKLESEPFRHDDVAQMWSGFHWQYHIIFSLKHEAEFGGCLATKSSRHYLKLDQMEKKLKRLPGIHSLENEERKKPNKVNSSKERLETGALKSSSSLSCSSMPINVYWVLTMCKAQWWGFRYNGLQELRFWIKDSNHFLQYKHVNLSFVNLFSFFLST